MALGVNLNNPGDLTVFGSSSYLYPGQSGVAQANGLYYAVFPDPATGAQALQGYVSRNVAAGHDTLSDLVYHFLGTSQDNSANPHVAGYLSAVENYTGLNANSDITHVDPSLIAGGISKAEGTAGAFGSLFSGASSGAPSIAQSGNILDQVDKWLSDAFDPNSGMNKAVGKATGLDKTGNFLANYGNRFSFAVVGALLLAAGIFVLAGGPKVVVQGAKTAASGAIKGAIA